MANKVKELGIVKEVHDTGMVETDKGIRSSITAKVGDRLVQCLSTRKISIAVKKTDAVVIEKDDYINLDVEALKEKFKIKELKAIAKMQNLQGYSKLKEDELALMIFDSLNQELNLDGGDE